MPPPHPTSWSSILIVSFHICLGLSSGLLPSGFLTKTQYTSLLSPIRATYPSHLILLDLVTRTIFGEQCRWLSSSLCSFHNRVLSIALNNIRAITLGATFFHTFRIAGIYTILKLYKKREFLWIIDLYIKRGNFFFLHNSVLQLTSIPSILHLFVLTEGGKAGRNIL